MRKNPEENRGESPERDVRDFKAHRLHYRPVDGQAWNPMRSWPRNEACFCGSGVKFKKCCMSRVSATVDASKLADLDRLLKARNKAGEALRVVKALREGAGMSSEAPQEAPDGPQ